MLGRHVAPGARLVLGLSGGVDSVVLFHLLRAARARLGFHLACVHVHHGLSARADDWAAFCQALCARHGIDCGVYRVAIDAADPAGIEAAARRARRQVFAALDADFVLTAHQADDQAETLLLQLLRGAGPKGLAAMAEASRPPGWKAGLLRPLLGVGRSAILAYARAAGLSWVDDESNADPAHTRNFLRHRVLPLIGARFPAATATLARAAALQAEALELLDDLADSDYRAAVAGGRLDCAWLSRLSAARARNLLRRFIGRAGLPMPSQRRLDEALHQLRDAAADARVAVPLDARHVLRRYRGGAWIVAARDCHAQAEVEWRGEAALTLVAAGCTVRFETAHGAGVDRARLAGGRVTLGVRHGGERIRLRPGGPHQSLKKLLQASAIPPWRRDCLPILRLDGCIVWAAGIGIDAEFRAAAGAPGIVLNWDETAHHGRGD